jgi:hypothetical protein
LTGLEGHGRPEAIDTLTAALPLEATASEVVLFVEPQPGSWQVRARFPLCGPA